MPLPWTLHGDGAHVAPGEVVAPGERLSWPRTIGLGAQHVVAMFGATFLVPIITGFPPTTTLFFSGLVFSTLLARTGNVSAAMASNLLGAMCGGLLEYNSMYFGFRFLYWIAIGLYAVAWVTMGRGVRPAA